MAAAVVHLDHVEEAIRAMRVVFEKNHPNFLLCPTCAPGDTVDYNRYIMFTHKIINPATNTLVCYITYRSKRPVLTEEPVFSSYEILDSGYSSIGKYHLDHSDGTFGVSTFKEVFKEIDKLLKQENRDD